MKDVLNLLPEAVIITTSDPRKDFDHNSSRSLIFDDELEDAKSILQFCNKAAGKLAREKLDEMSLEDLGKSKLLEMKLFQIRDSELKKNIEADSYHHDTNRKSSRINLLQMMRMHDVMRQRQIRQKEKEKY
jgi:hypothetical protein